MKIIIITFLLLFGFCNSSFTQQEKPADSKVQYDSLLAKKLGADQYGMKKYVMAFLKSGPVRIQDSTQRAELQRQHLKNILRLAKNGTLIVAGPFLDDQEIRGIFIFNVESVEEARKIAETDPAVKAGTLVLELHPWYGSAALIETLKIHKMIEKKSVVD
jgi:uncharacterized protein YciI